MIKFKRNPCESLREIHVKVMSADSTTGADLWEEKHVCSAFATLVLLQTEKNMWKFKRTLFESYEKSMWKFWEIHVKVMRDCMGSIYNLCFCKGEKIHVKVLAFAQVDELKAVFQPYIWEVVKYQREQFECYSLSRSWILRENYLSSLDQKYSKVSA